MTWRLRALHIAALVHGWWGYLLPLTVCALGLAGHLHWIPRQPMQLRAVWKPWVMARWPYTTTFGFGSVTHLEHMDNKRLLDHEQSHFRDWVDACLQGAAVHAGAWAAGANFWAAYALGCAVPALVVLNFVQGWARGARNATEAYLRSGHEEAARGKTDRTVYWPQGNRLLSWEENEQRMREHKD